MRKWLQKDDQGLHPNVRLPLTTEFILYGHFHRGKNGKKKQIQVGSSALVLAKHALSLIHEGTVL